MTTRARGELTPEEEDLLGIERPSLEEEAEQERIAAEKRDLRKKSLAAWMQNDEFRAWLWEKLIAFGAFENRFAASPTGFPDPNATWLNAGMKAAGWALWEEFDDAAPELASLMRRERGG